MKSLLKKALLELARVLSHRPTLKRWFLRLLSLSPRFHTRVLLALTNIRIQHGHFTQVDQSDLDRWGKQIHARLTHQTQQAHTKKTDQSCAS